jgi:hypothetical protein
MIKKDHHWVPTSSSQVIGADTAFTAVRVDGTVVTWGDDAGGADSSEVQRDLFAVEQVVASFYAFAAVRS